MRYAKRHIGGRAGFTLLEVILAMSLSFFLLAALYQAIVMQAQYNDFAAAEIRETQTARTLLRRLAEEIRAIEPPLSITARPLVPTSPRLDTMGPPLDGNVPDQTNPLANPTAGEASSLASPFPAEPSSPLFLPRAEQTRALLHLGEDETDGGDFTTSFDPATLSGTETVVTNPERFSLLGTSNRILFLCRHDDSGDSVVEQFHVDPTKLAQSQPGMGMDSKQSSAGNMRQILYMLRPNPELENRELGMNQDPEAEEPPTYRGLIRQEIKRPWSQESGIEARLQLEPFFQSEEERSQSAESLVTREEQSVEKTDEILPTEYVQTRLLSEDVTAIKFRYHDGSMWLDAWDREDQLPAAIEIALSFQAWSEEDEELAEMMPIEGEEGVEPFFPYRITICLPASGRLIRPVFESEAGNDGRAEKAEALGTEERP